jgi:uncharacterized protein (TIGR03000 family)
MYSIVVLAALTSGGGTPAGPFGHHGYYKDYGANYGGCYGVCYGGWGGVSHTGYWNGGWGLPFGGYGPDLPDHGPGWPGYACFGGCGGYSSLAYGMPMPTQSGPAREELPLEKDDKKAKDKDKGKGKGTDEVSADRAKLSFNLPKDAKLYVDDQPVDTADAGSFQTPVLEKGRVYYYEVRAEVMRDGKPVSETRRILVKCGAVIRTDFSALGTTTGVVSAK